MKQETISAAYQAEQDDNLRLRRADEALTAYRQQEAEARRALASAIEQTKRAKEKWEALFIECEKRACARREAGLIINSID